MSRWAPSGFNEKDPLADGVLAMCLSLVFSILGSAIGRAGSVSLGASRASMTPTSRLSTTDSNSRKAAVLIVLALSILAPSWLYFALLGTVPLVSGVGSVVQYGYQGLGELQSARIGNTPHLSGQSIPLKGYLDLMRSYGVLFLIGISLTQILQGAPRNLRIVITSAAVVTAIAGGQRWQLIYVVITVVAAISIGLSKRSLPLLQVLRWTSSLAALGFTLTLLQRRTQANIADVSSALSFAFSNLTERIIFEQSATPILSFANQSYEGGELKGLTYVQAVMAYIPGLNVHSFEVDFYAKVYGGTAAFTAAPGFFTEAFINFGLVGVVCISLLWGVILSVVDERALRRPSDLGPGMRAASAAMLAGTSFAGVGLVIAWLLLLFYIYIVRWSTVTAWTSWKPYRSVNRPRGWVIDPVNGTQCRT